MIPYYQNPGLPVTWLHYHESLVVSDDVAINTDDGRVFFSHPGQTVGGQLIDLAGKVDGATLTHC